MKSSLFERLAPSKGKKGIIPLLGGIAFANFRQAVAERTVFCYNSQKPWKG